MAHCLVAWPKRSLTTKTHNRVCLALLPPACSVRYIPMMSIGCSCRSVVLRRFVAVMRRFPAVVRSSYRRYVAFQNQSSISSYINVNTSETSEASLCSSCLLARKSGQVIEFMTRLKLGVCFTRVVFDFTSTITTTAASSRTLN